jgi:hypothetical protein
MNVMPRENSVFCCKVIRLANISQGHAEFFQKPCQMFVRQLLSIKIQNHPYGSVGKEINAYESC